MPESRPPRPSTQTPRPGAPPGAPAGPTATGSLVAQIVADQKKQKEELRTAMQRKEKRSKLGPIAAAVLIAANVVAWLVFPPVSGGGDRRKPGEVERDLRLVVASAASQVEIWRQAHEGRMPPTLATAGVTDSGLSLVNVDGTVYEVRGESHGIKLSYRSNTALTDFLDAGTPVAK